MIRLQWEITLFYCPYNALHALFLGTPVPKVPACPPRSPLPLSTALVSLGCLVFATFFQVLEAHPALFCLPGCCTTSCWIPWWRRKLVPLMLLWPGQSAWNRGRGVCHFIFLVIFFYFLMLNPWPGACQASVVPLSYAPVNLGCH